MSEKLIALPFKCTVRRCSKCGGKQRRIWCNRKFGECCEFIPPTVKTARKQLSVWKGRIVQPSKVKVAYCLPDQSLINSKVQNFFAYVKDPTPEQIEALEEEIGGVKVYQDETFAGRVAKG